MNNKFAGALSLSTAGLTAVIGMAGAQIAYATVLGRFYTGNITGEVLPGPGANLLWLVLSAVVVLAIVGLYFLFQPNKE
jgi:hypothetical protein